MSAVEDLLARWDAESKDGHHTTSPGAVAGDLRAALAQDAEHESVEFPVGSDLAEFFTTGEKVYLYCLVCSQDLPIDVNYLNQAIVVWNQHVEDMKASAE